MAAVAPAFEECGVRIDEDPVKGKVVFAERDIKAGEVIFSEQSFVSATWSTNVCDGCEEEKSESSPQCYCERTGEPKQMYSKVLSAHTEHRNKIVEMMAKHLDSVAEVDRARCVLKCLGMYERDPKSLDVVLSLTRANYEHCLADAKQLRFQVPEIFPKDFTDEQMATIISVLNCNSHELENLGGSGLFLSACRMEHSCVPNCSFTTYDSTLWMTAIRPIAKDEMLSIDYGNFFYRPTIERMESLYESYGFVCTCDGCMNQPDKCRSFKCSSASCTDGVVWRYPVVPTGPIAEPDELEFDWKCSKCGYLPTEDELDMFDIAEQQLLEEGFPESLEEIEELLKTTPLHERHYLLFWALDSFGCEGAALLALLNEEEQRVNLAEVWKRIISSMNELFPEPLHEKTIYYDNLAQVEVVLGNRNAAMEAYAKAYEISCIVSGVDCTPTKKLKKLSENPPANAAELRELYGAVKRRPEAEEDWEDDEEVEDDEEEEAEEEE